MTSRVEKTQQQQHREQQKKEPVRPEKQQQRNFYELLNVAPTADFEELKANYRQLIRKCHPDKLRKASTSTATSDPIEVGNQGDGVVIGGGSAIDIDIEERIVNSKAYDCDDRRVGANGRQATVGRAANASHTDTVTVDAAQAKEEEAEEVAGDFVAINEAWQTLKDPAKRQLYDAELLATKFQMHSNAFERLSLADMRRVRLIVSDYNDGGTELATQLVGNTIRSNPVSDESKTKTPATEASETAVTITPAITAKSPVTEVAPETATSTTMTAEEVPAAWSWCYTYECRCGGQYILDESELNEFLGVDIGIGETENSDGGVSDGRVRGEGHHTDDDDAEVVVECSECSLVIVVHRTDKKHNDKFMS